MRLVIPREFGLTFAKSYRGVLLVARLWIEWVLRLGQAIDLGVFRVFGLLPMVSEDQICKLFFGRIRTLKRLL